MARRRPTAVDLLPETPSQVALESIFLSQTDGDRAVIDALHKRIHPVNLWKYRRRRARPGLDLALFIEQTTEGRAPANGWTAASQPAASSAGSAA